MCRLGISCLDSLCDCRLGGHRIHHCWCSRLSHQLRSRPSRRSPRASSRRSRRGLDCNMRNLHQETYRHFLLMLVQMTSRLCLFQSSRSCLTRRASYPGNQTKNLWLCKFGALETMAFFPRPGYSLPWRIVAAAITHPQIHTDMQIQSNQSSQYIPIRSSPIKPVTPINPIRFYLQSTQPTPIQPSQSNPIDPIQPSLSTPINPIQST